MTQTLDLSLIGCSDLSALPGMEEARRYSRPIDLYNRCVHGIPPYRPWTPWGDTDAQLGRAHEFGTAQVGARIYLGGAHLVQPPSRPNPGGLKGLRYSLDYVSGVSGGSSPPWTTYPAEPQVSIECKNRRHFSLDHEGWTAQRPGLDVYVQIQGQLELIWRDRDFWTGTQIPDIGRSEVFVAVDGAELRRWTVHRDPDLGGALIEAAQKFYQDHILARRPPPIDDSEAWAAHLQRVYSRPSKPERDANPREIRAVARMRDLEDQINALQSERQLLENQLRGSVGPSAGLKMPDGTKVRWATWRGRVSHKDVADALALRLRLRPEEYADIQENHRGPEAQRFEVRFKRGRKK